MQNAGPVARAPQPEAVPPPRQRMATWTLRGDPWSPSMSTSRAPRAPMPPSCAASRPQCSARRDHTPTTAQHTGHSRHMDMHRRPNNPMIQSVIGRACIEKPLITSRRPRGPGSGPRRRTAAPRVRGVVLQLAHMRAVAAQTTNTASAQRGSARAARARRAAGRAQHPLCTEPTIHFYRPASTGSEQLRRRSEG